jgi:hypothetical protein
MLRKVIRHHTIHRAICMPEVLSVSIQCVVMKVLVTISGRLYCRVIFKIVSFLEEHEDGFIYDSFFTPTIFVAIFWGAYVLVSQSEDGCSKLDQR